MLYGPNRWKCSVHQGFSGACTILLFYTLNIGSKFLYHFKEIIFLNSLLLSRSISEEQHCSNGHLPAVTSWVKGMDTTENCFAWQQVSDVNEQIKLFFILIKGTSKENYLHSMQCKATTYIFITGMTQPFHLKSYSFFATFVRWSLSCKSKPQIHWNTGDVHIQAFTSIKVQNIHFQSVCCAFFFFFSILYSLGSAGEKHTHDALFPPCPVQSVMGKNWGRLGEGSADEKIYTLMSNSFSKKEMLTLQVCFLCREYLTVPSLSSAVQS